MLASSTLRFNKADERRQNTKWDYLLLLIIRRVRHNPWIEPSLFAIASKF
jgi:hypothetical protein